mmetsp:Transcript_97625/g.172918  ORF Transcript_97625/g.172918 Transcript_97625/m.172918 type:complete len:248 (+) Transcript_97625:63-806(+)
MNLKLIFFAWLGAHVKQCDAATSGVSAEVCDDSGNSCLETTSMEFSVESDDDETDDESSLLQAKADLHARRDPPPAVEQPATQHSQGRDQAAGLPVSADVKRQEIDSRSAAPEPAPDRRLTEASQPQSKGPSDAEGAVLVAPAFSVEKWSKSDILTFSQADALHPGSTHYYKMITIGVITCLILLPVIIMAAVWTVKKSAKRSRDRNCQQEIPQALYDMLCLEPQDVDKIKYVRSASELPPARLVKS